MKHNIDACAGVVDADYRGVVHVVLHNHGTCAFSIAQGERIAQLVFERIETPLLKVVPETTIAPAKETARGAGGFGSTGL